MNISCLPLGDYQANCYLITDDKTKSAAVVDPGIPSDELNDLLLGYNLEYILLTHGHFDHIFGCESLKAIYPDCKICIHKADEICLNDKVWNLVGDFDGYLPDLKADILLDDSDIIKLSDNIVFKVIHTPGHSKGSVCFYDENNKVIFSGDTLFCRTVGRTDFIGGDFDLMMDSIKKLSLLPLETAVFPGHNRSTTIEDEKCKNRYMRKL